MKICDFKDRLKEALKIRNMKQVELAKKSNLDKSVISCYLNGKYEARQDTLNIIADVLQVSPVWLMGYDVPIDIESEMISSDDFISTSVNDLYKKTLNCISGVKDNDKKSLIITGLIKKLEEYIKIKLI